MPFPSKEERREIIKKLKRMTEDLIEKREIYQKDLDEREKEIEEYMEGIAVGT